MIVRLSIAFLFVSVPVIGQTRIYTDADLGKPLQWTAPAVTPEQLQSLAANQFRSIPPSRGPQVIVIGSSTTDGPFGPFYMTRPEPLLSPPWIVTTFIGRGRHGLGNGQYVAPFSYGPFNPGYPGVAGYSQPVAPFWTSPLGRLVADRQETIHHRRR